MNVGTILKYMYVKILKQWRPMTLRKKDFGNTVGKEKMVVTSIFSFSKNVFDCIKN